MIRFIRAHAFTTWYLLSMAIALGVTVWRDIHAADFLARTGQEFEYLPRIWEGLKAFHDGAIYPNIPSVLSVAIHDPIYFGIFLFAGAPTISAIVVVALTDGGKGVMRLFARLRPWSSGAFRKDAVITYGVLASAFFALCLAYLAFGAARQGPQVAIDAMEIWGLPLLLFPVTFLIGGLVDEGATLEELGWRGFGLPLMLEWMRSPLVVSILLGFLWWFWHFPREVPELMSNGVPAAFVVGQAQFLALTVSMSVIMTYCFHRTGGSVLPAILLHGWGNFFTKAMPFQEELSSYDLRLWIYCAVAMLVAVLAGKSLGRRRYELLKADTAS